MKLGRVPAASNFASSRWNSPMVTSSRCFFQLKEDSLGVRFTQPVLDTLLLSAVIHPNQESHKLEAIAERFGINVIGRHTALGDSFVTGEVFLKMTALLQEMGITTLRQALEAAEKTYFARVKY